MGCEEYVPNLTALLHHELGLADQQALESHLKNCADCRVKYQELVAVTKTLRTAVPVEPSARARRELQERIGGVMIKDDAPPQLSAPQKSDSGWRLPAPSDRQPRALPTSPGKPEVAGTSPSQRIVSARLEAVNRRSRSKDRKLLAIVIALLLIVTGGVLGYVLSMRTPKTGTEARIEESLAAQRRLEERQVAAVRNQKTDTLISTQLQLGNSAGENATLHILPHCSPKSGEVCLVAYRDKDIDRIKRESRIDQVAFEQMLTSAIVVTSTEGKCPVPRELIEKYIGKELKAVVLAFDNRLEIWAAPRFEKYSQKVGEILPIDAPPCNGLPPEKH